MPLDLPKPIAEYFAADVRVEEEVRDLIDKTISRFGRLDVAVNNAGTEGKPGPVTEQTADSYAAIFETNVLGTEKLLEAVRAATPSARVLYVGSADAYGAVTPADLPLRETMPLRPANPYAASKAAAEAIALQYARAGMLDIVATRSFNHTGPGQRPPFAVPVFAKQIAEIARGIAAPLLRVGNLNPRRDFSDVRDVVRAYRLIAERGVCGTAYNVCSGKSVAMHEIVEQLVSAAGVNISLEVDPARLRPSDTPEIVGDNSLLREHTRWEPAIALSQTLRDVFDWYAQGPHS